MRGAGISERDRAVDVNPKILQGDFRRSERDHAVLRLVSISRAEQRSPERARSSKPCRCEHEPVIKGATLGANPCHGLERRTCRSGRSGVYRYLVRSHVSHCDLRGHEGAAVVGPSERGGAPVVVLDECDDPPGEVVEGVELSPAQESTLQDGKEQLD